MSDTIKSQVAKFQLQRFEVDYPWSLDCWTLQMATDVGTSLKWPVLFQLKLQLSLKSKGWTKFPVWRTTTVFAKCRYGDMTVKCWTGLTFHFAGMMSCRLRRHGPPVPDLLQSTTHSRVRQVYYYLGQQQFRGWNIIYPAIWAKLCFTIPV